MATIDITETEVRLWDGGLRTATLDSAAVDSDLTITEVSRNNGSYAPRITLVDPLSPDSPLSVSVAANTRDITVSLETDSMSTLISTAAQVKTAIDADADASALVTVTLETAGAGVVDAIARTQLDGAVKNSLIVKIGQGTVTFSSKRPREFRLDRNLLDSVRESAQEPMDVTFAAEWEYISSISGATVPQIMEVLEKIGPAAAWVSTALDQCQPHCIDVEVLNQPNCSGEEDESTVFPEFYFESRDGDLTAGSFSLSGRCNATKEISIRIPV